MEKLKQLLEGVKEGQISVEQAMKALEKLPYEDIGFAKIDHHRVLRRGIPEVIFCEGKSSDQVVKIAQHMLMTGSNVMGTRANIETFNKVKKPYLKPHTMKKPVFLQWNAKKPFK